MLYYFMWIWSCYNIETRQPVTCCVLLLFCCYCLYRYAALDSNSVLNVNVTSSLLEQWSQTSHKWAEDYQKMPSWVSSNICYMAFLIGCIASLAHSSVYLSYTGISKFLRATAGTAIARLSHRNSVRLSVRPSVRHTGGSGKNGAS